MRGRAFSMVETVVSIMIVGGLLVVSMNVAGAAAVGQHKTGNRGKGMLLAEALMDEILRGDYEDPDQAAGSFGVESIDAGDGSRALWNDVDDYDGWSKSPPEAKTGVVMTNMSGWERTVVVDWVNATNLIGISGTNTGVKRITVTVKLNGLTVAELVAIRAGAPPESILDPRKPPPVEAV